MESLQTEMGEMCKNVDTDVSPGGPGNVRNYILFNKKLRQLGHGLKFLDGFMWCFGKPSCKVWMNASSVFRLLKEGKATQVGFHKRN